MGMSRRDEMQLVGRDGELWLYASEDKKTGVLYDSMQDTESEPAPLQTFFKWGNFEPVNNQEQVNA